MRGGRGEGVRWYTARYGTLKVRWAAAIVTLFPRLLYVVTRGQLKFNRDIGWIPPTHRSRSSFFALDSSSLTTGHLSYSFKYYFRLLRDTG